MHPVPDNSIEIQSSPLSASPRSSLTGIDESDTQIELLTPTYSSSDELQTGTESEEVSDLSTQPIEVVGIEHPCTTSSQPSEHCIDIGYVFSPKNSIDDLLNALDGLSNAEKYAYVFKHISPPRVLPKTQSHGCYRKFNIDWIKKYPWLRYSSQLDGVFCGPCAMLLPTDSRRDKGVLVNKPFSNWVKISDALKTHSSHIYHRDCMQAAEDSITNPLSSRIDIITNTQLQNRIAQNEHILKQIVRAVLVLGKQGLPFRGDKEDITSSRNPGNFLALLKDYSKVDEILHDHLYHPKAKNATYMSPRSQNDIISVIGNDIIRASIIGEVKKAQFFSVLADEVSSHNIEHLPICIRFVDARHEIREEFIAFAKLKRVRAADIADAIIKILEDLQLSLEDLRGQGYNGASTMAGERSGVQKRIREIQSKALYTHCAGHSLNLAIVNSCSVTPIQNCIAQIKGITIWIKYSPKREELLKAVYQKGMQSGASKSRFPLLNVCITRWVENIDGWERFCLCHPFLVQMCEVIIYGDADYELFNGNWSADDKINTMAHLKTLELFEFIFSLVTLQRTLLYLREASTKLQGYTQDIVSGVVLIEQARKDLDNLRTTVDDYSHRIFEHSSRTAEKSNITISMPRISKKQAHRANIEFHSVEDYFKKAVVIPFLDHLTSNLSSRFDAHVKQAALIQNLIPSKVTEKLKLIDIAEGVDFYKDDLENPDVVDEELHRWKMKWLSVRYKDRPQRLSDTLKECGGFPNIFILLKLFATLPLSSCSCEHSASTLRRLNNYMRCRQTEE